MFVVQSTATPLMLQLLTLQPVNLVVMFLNIFLSVSLFRNSVISYFHRAQLSSVYTFCPIVLSPCVLHCVYPTGAISISHQTGLVLLLVVS